MKLQTLVPQYNVFDLKKKHPLEYLLLFDFSLI